MSTPRMRRIRLAAGTAMRRRPDGKLDRTRTEMITLGLPSTAPGGEPAWCFRRRRGELWWVLREDAEVLGDVD